MVVVGRCLLLFLGERRTCFSPSCVLFCAFWENVRAIVGSIIRRESVCRLVDAIMVNARLSLREL